MSAELTGRAVAILGWAGASERQLRAISSFYRGHGALPFTTRSRVFRNMADPRGWSLEGVSLAARMRARLRRGEGPLVVHLFSNAGFWTYAAALRALGAVERAQIHRVVLDSAPGFGPRITGRFYADQASRAMMPMALRALGRPAALSHPLLTPPLWVFMRGWFHAGRAQVREAERSLSVVRATEAPMLFLYSGADELVRAADVETFVDSLDPARVQCMRFDTSPHVAHMVHHRGTYFRCVERFLSSTSDAVAAGVAGGSTEYLGSFR